MTIYGKDISCTDSLKTGRYTAGLRLIAESIYRRLITREGELLGGEDEQRFGVRVADFLGATTSPGEVAKLRARIRAQVLRDPRVDSVDVTVTEVAQGPDRAWEISLNVFTGQGPFELTLSVENVTTQLIGFRAT